MKYKSEYIVPIGIGEMHVLNTGDWRTQRPVINQDRCSKCGVCLMYCPVNSIRRTDGKFEVAYDYCKGCAVCAHECPKKAIDLIPEEKK